MLIYDITSLLQTQFDNCYIFNPSIIHLEGSIYAICYRICKYNYPASVEYHNPWKTWDNGYKLFSNPARVLQLKYRRARDFDGSAEFELTKTAAGLPDTDEYDSTSLAIIELSDSPKVLYNVNRIFGDRMYQDARLWRRGDQLHISYNVFHARDHICLRQRTLDIDLRAETGFLGVESLLFDHIYQRAEKNCVPSPFGRAILYSIGYTFDIIIKEGLGREGFVRRVACPLSKLIDYYGKDKIEGSISTPAIPYGRKRWLACAHIKVSYKKIDKEPFKSFISKFSFKPEGNIYPHGKYIYFAYFFEFNKEYKITRHSNLFIPTLFGDYLPYLLVMPTGLCRLSDDKICLSYGEGDKKCKLLILDEDEIGALLETKRDDLGAYLLTARAYIQHIGYFGFKNTGDDAFVKVFSYLQQKYYPYAHIEFLKPRQNPARKTRPNLTIIGGGDVINSHFLAGLEGRKNMIAISVGVPYEEFNSSLSMFESVICRSLEDSANLKEYNPRIEYFPDICFLLPKIYKAPRIIRPRVIGISVLRTYYNPDFPEVYNAYIQATAEWIGIILSREPVIQFLLIPFGVNFKKDGENDLIACRDICELVGQSNVTFLIIDPSLPEVVEHIYSTIRTLSFMVCARFHSHVFSATAGVPFVSLTLGKKCIDFMRQSNLEEYMYILEKNELDLPVNMNSRAIAQFVHHAYHQLCEIEKRVMAVKGKNMLEMQKFEDRYIQILKDSAAEGELLLS
jgi:hypothetical protein